MIVCMDVHAQALCAYANVCTSTCDDGRFYAVFNQTEKNGEIIFGFLVLLGFNVLFAIIASVLVALEVSKSHSIFSFFYPLH